MLQGAEVGYRLDNLGCSILGFDFGAQGSGLPNRQGFWVSGFECLVLHSSPVTRARKASTDSRNQKSGFGVGFRIQNRSQAGRVRG